MNPYYFGTLIQFVPEIAPCYVMTSLDKNENVGKQLEYNFKKNKWLYQNKDYMFLENQ